RTTMQTSSTDFGEVISVRGSQARIGIRRTPQVSQFEIRATVGRFLSIASAQSSIIAMVTEVSSEGLPQDDVKRFYAIASVDLLGEINSVKGAPRFQRGVTVYPAIGDQVNPIGNQELRTVYARSQNDCINVGALQQDHSVT